VEILKSF